MMKAITLRNLPDAVARRIAERARQTGRSLNRTVIDLLEETNQPRKASTYDDLDHLFGTWSEDEADAFDAALKEQRRIEQDDWR